MTGVPRVSVGLPVYNGERYLAGTLDDLLGQTFEDFELVVCDNASSDATPDLLADAARRDARVRVIRNDRNLGALANAYLAVARSRAPLFALAAYDDRHAPTFLEALVGALDADAEAGFAYGRSTLIDASDRPLAFDPRARRYRDASGATFDYDAALERPLPDDAVGRYQAVLRSNDVNAPIHGLFRRSLLERVGPHRVHGSDRLIVAHAALLRPVAFVDAPLFGFRIHPQSTYHLTRSEWLARESGTADAGSLLDGARTLGAYLRAVAGSPIPVADRARAAAATLRYAVRPAVLRRLLRPGPDNYLGWTGGRSAAASETAPTAVETASAETSTAGEGWGWLRACTPRVDGRGATEEHE